jgi:hypothetical protein
MEDTLKDAVHRQRVALAELLHAPIARLAEKCAVAWGKREELDIVLTGIGSITHAFRENPPRYQPSRRHPCT